MRENVVMEGYSGATRHFDLDCAEGPYGAGCLGEGLEPYHWCECDYWVGHVFGGCGLGSPIMIGEKFSDHAKSYSNRRKITLLTKQKLAVSCSLFNFIVVFWQ